jgi:acyl carrier protein
MSRDPLFDRTRALVERVVGPGRMLSEPGPDTRLNEEYLLDSVELLEVLVACEGEFGIVFEESRDFDDGSLQTLGTLANLIRSKQPGVG